MKSVLVCFSKIKLYIIMHRLELFRSYMIFYVYLLVYALVVSVVVFSFWTVTHTCMATTMGRLAWIRAAPVLPPFHY
jgi:hypothetical protein